MQSSITIPMDNQLCPVEISTDLASGFFVFHLRNSHCQNTILHRSLDLVHLSIFLQPEPPQEIAARPLHSVPHLVLLFLLLCPLPAYLQNLPILNLHFLHPGQIGLNCSRAPRPSPSSPPSHWQNVYG